METTCGIFILNNKSELLIVHPTNASWHSWSIPKGLVNPNETYLKAAIREVFEETNIDLNGHILEYVGEIKYPKRSKLLKAYFIQLDTDGSEFDLKCESTFIHKHTKEVLPENNSVQWQSLDKAKLLIHSTQLELLKTIK